MNRQWVFLGMIVLISGGCGMNISQTVSLSESTIKSSLDSYFPMSSDRWVKDAPVTVILTDPEILLEDGSDQLGFRVQFSIEKTEGDQRPLPPLPGKFKPPESPAVEDGDETPAGSATVFGEIEYQAEEGAFYFLNPTIREITLEVVPEPLQKPVRETTEAMLSKYLKENSVYTLSKEDLTSRTAKYLLKSVTVKNGKLVIELGM